MICRCLFCVRLYVRPYGKDSLLRPFSFFIHQNCLEQSVNFLMLPFHHSNSEFTPSSVLYTLAVRIEQGDIFQYGDGTFGFQL